MLVLLVYYYTIQVCRPRHKANNYVHAIIIYNRIESLLRSSNFEMAPNLDGLYIYDWFPISNLNIKHYHPCIIQLYFHITYNSSFINNSMLDSGRTRWFIFVLTTSIGLRSPLIIAVVIHDEPK